MKLLKLVNTANTKVIEFNTNAQAYQKGNLSNRKTSG